MGSRYLAIDIGASSGRAIAGEVDGQGYLKLTEVYRFENGMQERAGHLVWDIEGLFRHVLEGMIAAREQGFVPDTVAIDTWAVDYVLLDGDDCLLGDAVAYRDSRTEGVKEALERAGILSFEEHYGATGIQYQPFNTAYQLLALKREHPEELAEAKAFLMVPDYLNFRLCGIKANEYTNASTTALVGARTRDWDDALISRLGLPRKIFQDIRMPGTVLGPLAPEIARIVGYGAKVVLPATHDTGSAWLAVPARDDRAVYISSGTWSLLGSELGEPIATAESAQANFTNEGGYGGTYRYLKNIMGLWMIQNVRREQKRADGTVPGWGELVAAARQAADSGFSAVVDVDDARFLAPASMSEELRRACHETGQQTPDTAGELALVVYASLAQDYARSVQELSRLTGRTYTSVNIVGGGSANAYLNELTAKATGLPVFAGPMEGTALGNIMVQAIAAGDYAGIDEARSAIRKSFAIKEVYPDER